MLLLDYTSWTQLAKTVAEDAIVKILYATSLLSISEVYVILLKMQE